MPEIEAAIFDLDGVLADTAEHHYRAWQRLAREEGIPFTRADNEALRGVSRRASLALVLRGRPVSEAEAQALMERKNAYYVELIRRLTPADLLPGAASLLAELRAAGVKVAVASASRNARTVLDGLGLWGQIDALADGACAARSKPAPDLFLHAAACLGVPPSRCLVLEDAAAGVEAAQAAGMRALALGPSERFTSVRPDLVAPSLAGLSWPAILARLEEAQAALAAWTVCEPCFDPAALRRLESVFTVGNGALGTRGSFEERYPGDQPATLINGLFDATPIARSELVNAPGWPGLHLTLGGEPFALDRGRVLAYERTLDMQDGLLTRRLRWQSPAGHTFELRFERWASMAAVELCALRCAVTALDCPVDVELAADIDGTVENPGLLAPPEIGLRHWHILAHGNPGPQTAWLHARTRVSGVELAAAMHLAVEGVPEASYRPLDCAHVPGVAARVHLEPGQTAVATKLVAYAISVGQASQPAERRAGEPVPPVGQAFQPAERRDAEPVPLEGQAFQPAERRDAEPVPPVGQAFQPAERRDAEPVLPVGQAFQPAERRDAEPVPPVGQAFQPAEGRAGKPVPLEGQAFQSGERRAGKPVPLEGQAFQPAERRDAELVPLEGQAFQPAERRDAEPVPLEGQAFQSGERRAGKPVPLEGQAFQPAERRAGKPVPPVGQAFQPAERRDAEPVPLEGQAFQSGERRAGKPVPQEALALLEAALARGYESLLAAHRATWRDLWRDCDVQIEGDEAAQRAVRFNLYHLLIAAPRHTGHVSVPAKTLSGFGYRGHAFWDTDIFIVPFFTFTRPEIARNLLLYRYHTLPGARENARHAGLKGAMFAWESAADGRETTPPWVPLPNGGLVRIWCGEIELHITADVAYATWHYWQTTGDDDFMRDYGAEIILDTATFWGLRVEYNAAAQRYELSDVIGPDEYHEHVANNAFTNRMVQWHLAHALEILDWLRREHPAKARELEQRLELTPEQLALWNDIRQRMYIPFDAATGLFEQFSGFFQLEELDWPSLHGRSASIQQLLGIAATQKVQALKQADVLMLYFLGLEREARALEANWAYYEPRTDHTYGSSLGPAVHALLACRLGRADEAYQHFARAAFVDLEDLRGNTRDGIHAASAGGLWQAVVMGFAGLRATPARLTFTPRLPAGWRRLRFTVQHRGQLQEVDLCAHPGS